MFEIIGAILLGLIWYWAPLWILGVIFGPLALVAKIGKYANKDKFHE